jgi:hypothetical protein
MHAVRSKGRVLLLLVVAVGLAWYLWRQVKRREYTMPDGTTIRVERVSYGSLEHIQLLSPMEKLRAALPAALQAKLAGPKPPLLTGSWSRNAVTHPSEDALYIYISRRDRENHYGGVNASRAEVVDEDGCVFAATQVGGFEYGLLGSRKFARRTNYSVGFFRFEAFPRREKKFRFLVQDDGPATAGESATPAFAQFIVANPTPRTPEVHWPVESLPVTRTQGSVSFVLTNVVFETNNYPWLPSNLKRKVLLPECQFSEEGRASTNWEAVETDLFDISGNFVSGAAGYRGSLCPRESAWKMRVKFFGGEKSLAASNAVWTLRGLAVPGAGHFTLLKQSDTLQGVKVSAVRFFGTGQFTLSNNMVLEGAPAKEPITNESLRIIYMPPASTGKNSDEKAVYNIEVAHPRLAFAWGYLNDDQQLTVCAVDDQGREFYAHNLGWRISNPPMGREPRHVNYLNNLSDTGESVLSVDLPLDARTVDLTFCVHTCQTEEFIFAPPQRQSP